MSRWGTTGALDGLRVLDFTQMLAGPYCTMVLADLGADVIKVEPPGGDVTRGTGPHLADDGAREFGAYFQSINRNKRSLALDLKSEAGREVVRELIPTCDVLVENFRADVMERLGLGYECLAELNPRLVYAAIRGFGDPRTGRSPYLDWPAYDVVAQAMGGVMATTGPDRDHPMKAGPGIGDVFPAVMAAVGILAALRHAEHTGVGQFLDVAMYDAMVALCERSVYLYTYTGEESVPMGNQHPLLSPFGAFPTVDGWVALAASHDHFWVALCEIMGRAELADDPRFAANADRCRHDDEVAAVVTRWTSERTTAAVVAAVAGRVPCGPVNGAAAIVSDPHLQARAMLVDLPHPGSDRTPAVVGTPIKLAGSPGPDFRRAPRLGEHGAAILGELGLDRDRIDALRAAAVLVEPDVVVPPSGGAR